ncbi:MAG: glutaredoxin family protein [Halanaerobiaceae bacterium]
MDNSNLVLYYFPSCPYCQKVLRFLKRNNIEINLRNIHKDKAADKKLVEVGGKRQVPCLFIDGKPMYESDDIIEWFKNNYNN